MVWLREQAAEIFGEGGREKKRARKEAKRWDRCCRHVVSRLDDAKEGREKVRQQEAETGEGR